MISIENGITNGGEVKYRPAGISTWKLDGQARVPDGRGSRAGRTVATGDGEVAKPAAPVEGVAFAGLVGAAAVDPRGSGWRTARATPSSSRQAPPRAARDGMLAGRCVIDTSGRPCTGPW